MLPRMNRVPFIPVRCGIFVPVQVLNHFQMARKDLQRQHEEEKRRQYEESLQKSGHKTTVSAGQIKRGERAIREAYKRDRKLDSYLTDDTNFVSFQNQLAKMGLQLRDIPGDGNCLFRALGDQLEGHSRNHYKHRADVVKYIVVNRSDFEPFIEDDVPFDIHLKNLQKLGTYAGNDAIVAFSKCNGVNILIHQLGAPCIEIHGSSKSGARQIHIAYHNGDHYSSVRRLDDNTESPAYIKIHAGPNNVHQKGKLKANMGGGYLKHNCCSHDGAAHVLRSQSDIEEEVSLASGCKDFEQVRKALDENDFDPEAAICELMQLMELSDPASSSSTQYTCTTTTMPSGTHGDIWADNGTGTRIFGSNGVSKLTGSTKQSNDSFSSSGYGSVRGEGGARPKQQRGTLERRQKKADKKKRAEDRHKHKFGGTVSPDMSEEETSSVILSADTMFIKG